MIITKDQEVLCFKQVIEVQVPTFYEIITDDQQTKPTDQPKDGHVRSHGEVTLQTTIAIHSVQKLLLHQ